MISVILAFFVSRIISEGGDYDRLVFDSSALIDESIDLKARLDSMNFDWHDKRIFEDFDFREVEADLKELAYSSRETKVELTRQILPRLYYPENFVHELDKLINNGVATHSLLSYKAISRLGDWEHINAFLIR